MTAFANGRSPSGQPTWVETGPNQFPEKMAGENGEQTSVSGCIQRYCGANEGLKRLSINLFAVTDINGSPSVSV
jgi:hypothetical protein